jgi:hypothetical protein
MRAPKVASALALTRRAVVGASTALPLAAMPFAASGSDETIRLCRSWLSTEAQIFRLQERWSDVENHVVAKYDNWFTLTEDEQRKLPDAAEMFEIDARMDAIQDAREDIIPRLPGLIATTREAILMKFEVVADLLRLEDHRDELNLLNSARRDLDAAWR